MNAAPQPITPYKPAMELHHLLTVSDGTVLGYRLWQAAENPSRRVIVLLHGMASNLTRWSEFLEYTTLTRSWDILRPDLRGHGESFTRGRIGVKRWCPDLLAVLDKEGYEQAVLIGHSLGAQVAVEFAARFPARTHGLVLIDPILTGTLHGSAIWIRRFAPLIWLAVGLIRLLNLFGLYRRRIPPRDLRRLDEQTRGRLLEQGKQEEMIRLYTSPLADLKHFPTASYLQEYIEVTRPLPPLADIRLPTLVLLSRGVTFTDPEATKRLLAPLSHVEIATIDAYHWPLTEKPADVRRAIEDWCTKTFVEP